MEAWQLVGCGPASGCIGCPPTTEEQRLYFFSCEEVAPEDGGAAAEEQPQMIGPLSVPRPFAGVGMVDSLMPQWDKTGGNWEIMPEDLRMVAEYEAWLPARVFDAHAHIWNFAYHSPQVEGSFAAYQTSRQHQEIGDWQLYQKQMARFIPNRTLGGLALASPNMSADVAGNSAWTAEESRRATAASGSSLFVCAMTITMDTTYEDIVAGVERFGYVGLKPYHCFAKDIEETFDATIMQYVSHEHCRAAHDLGLTLSIRAPHSPLRVPLLSPTSPLQRPPDPGCVRHGAAARAVRRLQPRGCAHALRALPQYAAGALPFRPRLQHAPHDRCHRPAEGPGQPLL